MKVVRVDGSEIGRNECGSYRACLRKFWPLTATEGKKKRKKNEMRKEGRKEGDGAHIKPT